jgi:hypothetical protein
MKRRGKSERKGEELKKRERFFVSLQSTIANLLIYYLLSAIKEKGTI